MEQVSAGNYVEDSVFNMLAVGGELVLSGEVLVV